MQIYNQLVFLLKLYLYSSKIKLIRMKNLFFTLLGFFGMQSCDSQKVVKEQSIYDFTMKNIKGENVSLANYKGKTLLIVNVASKCGLTPQYKDLEALYQKYKKDGLMILGFPANNFLWQEPGSDQDIAQFCSLNYGVSFDMFSKISVKGKNQHPLYTFLTTKKYNKLKDASVTWNFQKFLIDSKGNIVHVFSPSEGVLDAKNEQIIKQTLPK